VIGTISTLAGGPLRDACAAQKAVSNHIAVRTVPLQPRILRPRNRGQYAECQHQHRDGDQLRPPKESAVVNYSHALSKGQPPVAARPQSSRKTPQNASGKAKGMIFAVVYRQLVLRLEYGQAVDGIAHRL
jgi:hypothetical protein